MTKLPEDPPRAVSEVSKKARQADYGEVELRVEEEEEEDEPEIDYEVEKILDY